VRVQRRATPLPIRGGCVLRGVTDAASVFAGHSRRRRVATPTGCRTHVGRLEPISSLQTLVNRFGASSVYLTATVIPTRTSARWRRCGTRCAAAGSSTGGPRDDAHLRRRRSSGVAPRGQRVSAAGLAAAIPACRIPEGYRSSAGVGRNEDLAWQSRQFPREHEDNCPIASRHYFLREANSLAPLLGGPTRVGSRARALWSRAVLQARRYP
jgi:hypothetical protein